MKFRILTPRGSGFEARFVKCKIVRRDGIWQIKSGFWKPKYYPYKSDMDSDVINGRQIPAKLGNGLEINVPNDVMIWNINQKVWALSEHTKPSWLIKYKTLLGLLAVGALYIIVLIIVGAKFNTMLDSSMLWIDKMDAIALASGGI